MKIIFGSHFIPLIEGVPAWTGGRLLPFMKPMGV